MNGHEHDTRRFLTGRGLLVIAIALFAAASALHIMCGDFPKAIDVLPDERRYIEIARSLFTGNGLIIRGDASDFQKILYPLSLFPALLFDDGAEQIRMVGVLNSLYACSTVFPVLILARKIFDSSHAVIASMLLAVMTPDLMYSMTFMSESLFMPLSLWLICACWHCMGLHGARAFALSALSGFLCYITYLCKEVALMFLIAFIAWQVVALLRKRRSVSNSLISLGAFLAGFLVPFAIMKLTLFSGLHNSYTQFSFDILRSPYTVLFGLYSATVDGVYFIIGFGVFPVLFLALAYRCAPRTLRDLLFFCLASLAIGLAVVVFTISMREDVGHVALRPHLRYVAPLALPLLMLFMKFVADDGARFAFGTARRRSIAFAATGAFCALVAGFFGSANLQQGFDFSQFHLLRWLLGEVPALEKSFFDDKQLAFFAISDADGDLLAINPVDWAVRAAVIVLTAIGALFLLSPNPSRRKRAGIAICSVIAALMVANSVALYHYNRGAYDVKRDDVSEICTISDQLAATAANSGVMVVLDAENTGANNLIDTYLQDGAGAYRYVTIDTFRAIAEHTAHPEGLEAKITTLSDDLTLEGVDYLLVNNDQHVDVDGLGASAIGFGFESPRFTLYQLSNISGEQPDEPSPLPIAVPARTA